VLPCLNFCRPSIQNLGGALKLSFALLTTVLLWGAVAFGNVPGLQVYVVRQSERHASRVIDVASGLNITAFNLGIVGDAWAGGLIVSHLRLIHTSWIGALTDLAKQSWTRV
jgi:predicted MFS family arabinose efflux permease